MDTTKEVKLVSYQPVNRYLKLHNGDIYDRDSDTIIRRKALLEVMNDVETD
jgi:hypothetical protein